MHEFLQPLDPCLEFDDGVGDLHVGGLRTDRVGLPSEFLRQELERPARRLAIEEPAELVDVAFEPDEFLGDVGPVGDEGDLADDVGRRDDGVVLGEDAADCGISESALKGLELLVAMGILKNKSTSHATVVLPSSAWAEKRGSMINVKNRLQRLNQAVQPPGHARDDWEILRDLIRAVSGPNGFSSIEDVFKQMAAETSALNGLSLSRIGDLGIQLG